MDTLDLTKGPPREPRAEVGGIVFLPRSIDKARASLEGGQLGEYTMDGFTEKMLGELGIDRHAFIAAVAEANADADVAAFVLDRARAGGVDAWNAFVTHRELFGGDRNAAIAEYPWLAQRPDLRLSLDFIAEDDRRTFTTKT